MQYYSKLLQPPFFLVPHTNKIHSDRISVPGPLTSFTLSSYLFLFPRRHDKIRFVISIIKLDTLVHKENHL